MSEDKGIDVKLDQPRKRADRRRLRPILLTFGIIAFFLASFLAWIAYRQFREAEILADIKKTGASISSKPVPYAWMQPFLNDTTKSFIESISPLEYEVKLDGIVANQDVIKKTLLLPNLVALSAFVDDEIIAAVAQSTSLRSLHLSGSTISEQGISVLAQMPHLEELRMGRVALSEKGLATLLNMNQLKELSLGHNDLDLIESFRFEITGTNASKTIKVGDIVTFTGTFRSTKISPTTVDLHCYQWSHGFTFNLRGTVKQLSKDTFQFVVKAPTKIELPGYHGVGLMFHTAGPPRITIYLDYNDNEFNVADAAKPSSNALKLPDVKKTEGITTADSEVLKFKPKVELKWPGKPTEFNQFLPTEDGECKLYNATFTDKQAERVAVFGAGERVTVYGAGVIESPPKTRRETSDKELLAAFASKKGVTSSKEIVQGPKKYPGLEITAKSGKFFRRELVILAWPRLYTIGVTSNDEQALKTPQVNEFFESVVIRE